MKSPLACLGALRSASSCGSDGRISSARVTLTIGTACAVGSTFGHVQFLQFFDVAEDAAELRGEFFFLVGRERDAREVRDVFDVNFSGSHAGKLKSNVQS